MGKKNYKPEEHGYMPLPPLDEDGEPIIPLNKDEQINLRDKFAPWDNKPAAPEVAAESETEEAVQPLTADTFQATGAAMPTAPELELDPYAIESGASENFGTKVAAVGLIAKARAGALRDKIRQNPAAAIAGLAGAAVVTALIILTFVWTRSAGDVVKPDYIAGDNGHEDWREDEGDPGFPEGDNSNEESPKDGGKVIDTPEKIADLVCIADRKTDSLYGFKGFDNMAVERRVTFTVQNTPNELFVTNIFSFSKPEQVAVREAEYKKAFDAKYPKATRGFSVAWSSSKNTGIKMTLSARLANNPLISMLSDAQLRQFGLQPDKNADGTLTANYTREELQKRWTAEGFNCGRNSVASR
ncbi:hypothetical protein FWG76_01525 [Candidatus Saccharibacteria bacterium]|nr:hypothetical protein [Candidatus Saccharibacteria bacterium]